MKKLSKITESIWSDIQDRSSGETIRKEDKFNPDYVDFGDDTTVYWAIDNLEIDGEGKFYFDDIKDYNNNGWRLPTVDEVNQLKWNIWISWYEGCNHLKFDDGNELKLKTNDSDGFHMWTKEINTKFPDAAYAYGFDNSHDFDITSFNKSINKLFVFLVKDKKITESIWSDMQDRSAGDTIREEDKITTNRELRKKIYELYIEQGEGETLDVSSLTNIIKCDDFSGIFQGYEDIEHIIGLEDWDVSNVRNMRCMFSACKNFNSDLSKWDVSHVENMKHMFSYCCNFNSDLSNWDVSKVTDMKHMFYDCYNFNSDLSNWDVSNVENMDFMFNECKKFNSDLSKWNVSRVTNMKYMFYDCKSLEQIPSWYKE